MDEARDILANVVLCHIPVAQYNFQQKAGGCDTCSAPVPLLRSVSKLCDHSTSTRAASSYSGQTMCQRADFLTWQTWMRLPAWLQR